MSKNEISFLSDLRALMKAHEVKVIECDNYGWDENYEGATFHFVGGYIYIEIDETLNEVED